MPEMRPHSSASKTDRVHGATATPSQVSAGFLSVGDRTVRERVRKPSGDPIAFGLSALDGPPWTDVHFLRHYILPEVCDLATGDP